MIHIVAVKCVSTRVLCMYRDEIERAPRVWELTKECEIYLDDATLFSRLVATFPHPCSGSKGSGSRLGGARSKCIGTGRTVGDSPICTPRRTCAFHRNEGLKIKIKMGWEWLWNDKSRDKELGSFGKGAIWTIVNLSKDCRTRGSRRWLTRSHSGRRPQRSQWLQHSTAQSGRKKLPI